MRTMCGGVLGAEVAVVTTVADHQRRALLGTYLEQEQAPLVNIFFILNFKFF